MLFVQIYTGYGLKTWISGKTFIWLAHLLDFVKATFSPPCLFSSVSMCLQCYAPSRLCSTCLCSTMPLFHHVYVPPCLCSTMSMFHRVYVPSQVCTILVDRKPLCNTDWLMQFTFVCAFVLVYMSVCALCMRMSMRVLVCGSECESESESETLM